MKVLIPFLRHFQYQSTRSPSPQWTETAPAFHRSILLQCDDRHHCVPRTIAVTHTLYPPHPMIHVSLHLRHASVPILQYTSRHVCIIIFPQSASQHRLYSLEPFQSPNPPFLLHRCSHHPTQSLTILWDLVTHPHHIQSLSYTVLCLRHSIHSFRQRIPPSVLFP